ncbi:VCBS repeat-containing protein [candidate division KSB1 bacterium]|nr:VCBS repeat-containing protein [candidate division KSB1 bacterium]
MINLRYFTSRTIHKQLWLRKYFQSTLWCIIILFIELCPFTGSYAQVTFLNNGQQLNNLAGRGVALADFNQDNVLDAFVINEAGPDGKDNRLYYGDGHGLFYNSGIRLPNTPVWGTKPCAYDINNNGAIDAIVGRIIWFNNGDGTFSADSSRFVDSDNGTFMHMRLADVNNNGFIDAFVIIFNNMSTEGRIYLNDGQGNFQYTSQPIRLSIIGAGEFGDVNNDGNIDLLVSGWRNTSGAPCPNRVLLNDGAGNFTATNQTFDQAMRHSHCVALGDFDGDNDLDFVLIMQLAPYAKLYFNDGSGNFTAGNTLGTASVEKVALADFDNDSDVDIFLAGVGASEVWLNNGAGVFTDSGLRLGSEWSWDVALGDVNNDGWTDIFAANFKVDELTAEPWYVPRGRVAEVWLNSSGKKVDITFIGNEGFLITGVNGRVLIDGIYNQGYGQYPVPSTEVLTQERNAIAPFDHLTALLFTHQHPDHFHAGYAVDHLKNDTTCMLIGPSQVHTLLKAVNGYNAINDRIIDISYVATPDIDTTVQNMNFRTIALPHANNPAGNIENIGFLFDMNGYTIFHCGDANSTDIQAFQNANLAEANIDVAFLAKFFFDPDNTTGQEIIHYLHPKAIVLMHVDMTKYDYYQNIISSLPDIPPVYIMRTPMEQLTITDSSFVTSVQDNNSGHALPFHFNLLNIYPNPFNPSTTIKYQLPQLSNVNLKIYNILGQEIKTLIFNTIQNPGEYVIEWNGTDDSNKIVNSGIYFCSLETDDHSLQRKMVLVR